MPASSAKVYDWPALLTIYQTISKPFAATVSCWKAILHVLPVHDTDTCTRHCCALWHVRSACRCPPVCGPSGAAQPASAAVATIASQASGCRERVRSSEQDLPHRGSCVIVVPPVGRESAL